MSQLTLELLLPFILYAETHYKFKGIYSRLFKTEPEIIADAPYRVEPGQPIPILLLVKDAHRFPVEIVELRIEIQQHNRGIAKIAIPVQIALHDHRFWHRMIYVERPGDVSGRVKIDVQIIVKINGIIKKYHNDNYRISSHEPLVVYLAREPLLRLDNWYFGDFHYHSNYTEDQVEFGAPLAATVEMARAIGLNFFAVTDHSYDLDDHEDCWLENDHNLPKWHKFWQQVNELNRQLSDFVILPGEEVSAGNQRHRNVHLLIINNPKFIPGKGDSAERWLKTWPDYSIEHILEQIDDDALAIAAHPELPTPVLQWLLIRRGRWSWPDFLHQRLNGIQIWNGEYDRRFHRGSSNWIKLLLAGKKLSLIAGNDAHGNFNRFRQIGFPFFTFRENDSQLFGNMRTGVKISEKLSIQNILKSVKANHVLITTGPIIDLSVKNDAGQMATIGDEISGQSFILRLKAKSSDEFGKLESLRLLRGDLTSRKETTEFVISQFSHPYHYQWEQKLLNLSKYSYFRAELTTKTDEHSGRCLSNPIWIHCKN